MQIAFRLLRICVLQDKKISSPLLTWKSILSTPQLTISKLAPQEFTRGLAPPRASGFLGASRLRRLSDLANLEEGTCLRQQA